MEATTTFIYYVSIDVRLFGISFVVDVKGNVFTHKHIIYRIYKLSRLESLKADAFAQRGDRIHKAVSVNDFGPPFVKPATRDAPQLTKHNDTRNSVLKKGGLRARIG
jgi:hypothetical protein